MFRDASAFNADIGILASYSSLQLFEVTGTQDHCSTDTIMDYRIEKQTSLHLTNVLNIHYAQCF